MIRKPKLYARKGYVEVVTDAGEHVYRSIQNDPVTEIPKLQAQFNAQSDRTDFLEDCIAELAVQAYS